jgi:hypothetical protein
MDSSDPFTVIIFQRDCEGWAALSVIRFVVADQHIAQIFDYSMWPWILAVTPFTFPGAS